jgi:hypothetical protein
VNAFSRQHCLQNHSFNPCYIHIELLFFNFSVKSSVEVLESSKDKDHADGKVESRYCYFRRGHGRWVMIAMSFVKVLHARHMV